MDRWRIALVAVAWAAATVLTGCITAKQQIDPQARQLLREMSDVLAAAQSFSLESSVTLDEPSESGQLVRQDIHTQIIMSRPHRIYAHATGDDGERILCYNGKSLTLLSQDRLQYATITVPDSTDKMLDFIMDKYDLSLPLADLLYADPFSILTERVETGVYLGRESVLGHACNHLLFTQKNVDWQIWLDAGETPLPRKIVITRKSEPGCPEFIAVLDQWNLAATPADAVFQFQAPAGAKVVPMSELLDVE